MINLWNVRMYLSISRCLEIEFENQEALPAIEYEQICSYSRLFYSVLKEEAQVRICNGIWSKKTNISKAMTFTAEGAVNFQRHK